MSADFYLEWAGTGEIRTAAIPFALDGDGKWRDVDEVDRGLACACTCPACKGQVVARQGEIRVHHFAHHDRRECRHALEASLFGMTVSILSEPASVLRLPPIGNRHALAIEIGVTLSERQADKFFAAPWVVEAATISMVGAKVHARELETSSLERSDIVLPGESLAIHLISYRKTPQQVRQIVATKHEPVLGIDLRAYAKMWWEICDDRKEDRLKEAAQARGLMKKWLGEQVVGRGWLQNPEYERRLGELRIWAQQQREKQLAEEARQRREQALREQELERRHREAIERFKREDDSGLWRIPEPDPKTLPDQDSIGWVGTARGLEPKKPEMLKVVRADAQQGISDFLAADLGLFWHETRLLWLFVGAPQETVPSAVRRLLSNDTPWEVVTRAVHQQLRRAAYSPPTAAIDSTHSAAEAEIPPAIPTADTIVRKDVGRCLQCGAPTHQVLLGSGPYVGKRAVCCSIHRRHPMTLIRSE